MLAERIILSLLTFFLHSRESISLPSSPDSTTSGQDNKAEDDDGVLPPPHCATSTDHGELIHGNYELPQTKGLSPAQVVENDRKRTATEEGRNDMEDKCQAL